VAVPGILLPRSGRTLLIAVSRSGATTETLKACQAFQGQRGELELISCYGDEPLAALGDLNLVLPSGRNAA
jgi:glucosamine--fructose-6-phosphate aminotransferase (isomerizing)